MSKRVHSLLPGESLLKAARTMCEQHLHRLPVVDDEGRVVGIISTMDIVAAVVNAVDEMNATNFPDTGPPRKRS
jgi:CBS domain-containing protein